MIMLNLSVMQLPRYVESDPLLLYALGIPSKMFAAIFAMGRTIGWISHWDEMIADPEEKIGRPRQLYTGATRRGLPPENIKSS